MLSHMSRLVLVVISVAAIATLIVLIPQHVATKDRPAPIEQSATPPQEMMKIVPAEAGRDTRDWHMPTGDGSAN